MVIVAVAVNRFGIVIVTAGVVVNAVKARRIMGSTHCEGQHSQPDQLQS